MGLHELSPAPGARSQKRRRGRGDAGRRGSFAGRGMKGQKARGNIPPLFEGGQLPLVKRLPYMRGFHNRFRVAYVPVNLTRLAAFDENSEVSPDALRARNIVRKAGARVKILGGGEIAKPLMVSAHAFSKSARAKIEAAGGTATVIGEEANRTAEPAGGGE